LSFSPSHPRVLVSSSTRLLASSHTYVLCKLYVAAAVQAASRGGEGMEGAGEGGGGKGEGEEGGSAAPLLLGSYTPPFPEGERAAVVAGHERARRAEGLLEEERGRAVLLQQRASAMGASLAGKEVEAAQLQVRLCMLGFVIG
ncbi:unnamed protein product, partial [Closterium sp. NIES-54]